MARDGFVFGVAKGRVSIADCESWTASRTLVIARRILHEGHVSKVPPRLLRPPGRGSVSDGLDAMPCLAAGIHKYGYALNKRQANFISLRLANPAAIARSTAWLAFHNGRRA